MPTSDYQKRATQNYKDRMVDRGFVIFNTWMPKKLRDDFNSMSRTHGVSRREMFVDAISLYIASGAGCENSKQTQ